MEYRTGKCSQCGAEYKIPASFLHNVARCKVCKGVVHLGPAGGSGPAAPAPQRAARGPESEAASRPAAPRAVRPPAPAAEGSKRPAPSTPASAAAERPARERERSSVATTPAAGSRPRTEVAPRAEEEVVAARSAVASAKPKVALVAGIALAVVLALGFLFRDRLFGSASTTPPAESTPATGGPAQETQGASQAASGEAADPLAGPRTSD